MFQAGMGFEKWKCTDAVFSSRVTLTETMSSKENTTVMFLCEVTSPLALNSGTLLLTSAIFRFSESTARYESPEPEVRVTLNGPCTPYSKLLSALTPCHHQNTTAQSTPATNR